MTESHFITQRCRVQNQYARYIYTESLFSHRATSPDIFHRKHSSKSKVDTVPVHTYILLAFRIIHTTDSMDSILSREDDEWHIENHCAHLCLVAKLESCAPACKRNMRRGMRTHEFLRSDARKERNFIQ